MYRELNSLYNLDEYCPVQNFMFGPPFDLWAGNAVATNSGIGSKSKDLALWSLDNLLGAH